MNVSNNNNDNNDDDDDDDDNSMCFFPDMLIFNRWVFINGLYVLCVCSALQ